MISQPVEVKAAASFTRLPCSAPHRPVGVWKAPVSFPNTQLQTKQRTSLRHVGQSPKEKAEAEGDGGTFIGTLNLQVARRPAEIARIRYRR